MLRPVRALLAKKAIGPCTRVLAVLSICLLLGSSLTVQGTSQAFAAQAVPTIQAKAHTNWSFYMNSSSTTAAYDLGCDQGNADASDHHSSLVILDFGAQASNGSGAYFPGTSTFISNSQIEADAEAASHGYWTCTGSDTTTVLLLGIGTNNSGSNVGSTNGATWAHIVAAVKSFNASHGYSSQVSTFGANDIESWCGSFVGCKSPSDAKSWARGYSGVGGSLYFNFGSADACSTTSYSGGSCGSTGWTQYDYWYLSWGNPAALPTPEIYHNSWASQWEMIDLYGVHYQSGAMFFYGPMDEYDLDSSTDTSTQAWDALWSALNSHSSTAQNLVYSLQIHREA